MSLLRSHNLIISVIAAVLAMYPSASWSAARKKRICLAPRNFNGNYLNDTKAVNPQAAGIPTGVAAIFYEKSAMDRMGDRYKEMSRRREERHHYLTNTFNDEYNYDNESRSLVSTYFRTAIRRNIIGAYKKAHRGLKASVDYDRRDANRGSKVVAIEGKKDRKLVRVRQQHEGAASSPGARNSDSGEGIDVAMDHAIQSAWKFGENVVERHQAISLWPQAEALLHYDLPQNTMYMNLVSTIVDGEVKYRVSDTRLPFGESKENFTGERMTVGVSRSLGVLDGSTGVSYGVYESTMDASLSKHIHGPLSAQVNHSVSFRNQQLNNTTFQLNFGMGF